VQVEQAGFFPSHLSFLLRHRSHACDTRFLGPDFGLFVFKSSTFAALGPSLVTEL
jgi:hypothetical protein